jgi:predicted porin
MKKGLLASTALVGASLLAVSANAGTPTVGDNFEVSIDGTLRFGVLVWDQDEGFGTDASTRGYKFQTDESEVRFHMRGTADNGLAYGFDIEMQTQTDDTVNADETWMFLEGDWGRVELGDQDDAADRMFVGGEDVMPGRGGFDGDVGDVFNFGDINLSGPSLSITSDNTKVTYFTPRFAGFQVGASWTPDASQDGGDDTDGDDAVSNDSLYSLGLNYQNTFGDFGLTVAGTYTGGDHENSGVVEDPEVWGIGANVSYAGFELGAGYANHNETNILTAATAAGADAGEWWDVALAYTLGPWQVGVGYFNSNESNIAPAPDSEVSIFSIGANYTVAPGWTIASDINFVDAENITQTAPAVDNDGTVFVIATIMSF